MKQFFLYFYTDDRSVKSICENTFPFPYSIILFSFFHSFSKKINAIFLNFCKAEEKSRIFTSLFLLFKSRVLGWVQVLPGRKAERSG
jgi:hypothetical protein